jgi:surface antigen
MVAGKLSILLVTSPVLASDIANPRFFEYSAGGFANNLIDLSFGWFRTLADDQKEHYYRALMHAVMTAENGEKVSWYKRDASGYAVPVHTWPTGSGYCRRIHVQAIAYSTEKTMTATACYDNAHDNWRWSRQ